jgi:hypothetical protein
MTEPGKRRTPLQKAWQNLVIRSAGYYALLFGAWALLWRLFPGPMRVLQTGLMGERTASNGLTGRRALEEAITHPLLGGQLSSDMISAVVAMVGAGLFALPVSWIYVLTRQKKGFRQSQVHTLVMLPVVVAGVVVLVKNSLALAFSLGGIVAAVRFRNTLEDSKDAVYIFLSTGIGLAAGVDLPVAVALSLIFNLVSLTLWYSDLGRSSAALEGALAERRLQQVRAHVNRASGFIQRLDEELLKSMSAEQLDALADRARRRGRRHAPDGSEAERFRAQLWVRTSDVDTAMRAIEPLLPQYLKRWTLGSVVHEEEGTHVIDYAVQLKKSASPDQLLDALRAQGGDAILEVELQ